VARYGDDVARHRKIRRTDRTNAVGMAARRPIFRGCGIRATPTHPVVRIVLCF